MCNNVLVCTKILRFAKKKKKLKRLDVFKLQTTQKSLKLLFKKTLKFIAKINRQNHYQYTKYLAKYYFNRKYLPVLCKNS